ncbi:MAG TPA: LamG domain-containing protein [Verrucomicrobiota bacterium]|nr:LamG domain-containing protein [Verrucomicrobiota bacterium]HRZ36677.1 LamG domain-containing protein [Candidatus Paceibacterota bacterium]
MKHSVNRFFWPVVAAAALFSAQNGLCADWATEVSSANPVNWFRFDELSGSVVNDHGSANIDGSYVGAVGLGSAGLVGGAAAFDAGSHVFLGAANLPTDWTLEAIYKADTVAGGVSMGLVGADFAAASDRMAIKAEQWNETGQMGYTVFGVVDVTFTDSLAATPASFAHVVFVGQSSGVSLYVNGALAGSDATSTPLARWALGTGAIRADGTLVDPLTGVIDEIVIYGRALSPAEISAHYNAIPEPTVLTLGLLGALLVLGARYGVRRR